MLKVLAYVIGSVAFFPVSCTSGLFVGTWLNMQLDERDVSRGDPIHPQFRVVAEPGKDGQPFKVLKLEDLGGYHAQPGDTFLMSKPSASMPLEHGGQASYTVLENHGTSQVVEVIAGDDDLTVRGRYRATANEFTPLYSRLEYVGQMFAALPYAFAVAAALLWIGRRLRRKLGIAESGPARQPEESPT